MSAPVIVAARRTPIGTAGQSLAGVDAARLGGGVVAAASSDLARLGPTVSEVVLGNCMGPGGDVARVAALTAGLPFSVPALTVDRQCASGLAAIAVAASALRSERGAVVAGGVESASTAPWRSWPPSPASAQPVRYERAPFAPTADLDPDMGLANDLLAEERGITRERQDEYAARSHARALEAVRAGAFDAEVVEVAGAVRDDRPRALTVERLARLRPAFREGGTATAGNSCGISDGAAAVALVDSATYADLGVTGLRVLSSATAGVDPRRPGIGLVPAVRLALERAGLRLPDVDVVEINEAFAGQVLACCDELGLDPERVCPQGGALALGHPWGASGAVLVVRLFSQLVREGAGRYGLAAIAAGGGQGVALVVERCP
ncbi:MAG: thiolase family protein [Actinobacteria bacterium]|nr:thiolase family protein [Actinomycetota bacterium]